MPPAAPPGLEVKGRPHVQLQLTRRPGTGCLSSGESQVSQLSNWSGSAMLMIPFTTHDSGKCCVRTRELSGTYGRASCCPLVASFRRGALLCARLIVGTIHAAVTREYAIKSQLVRWSVISCPQRSFVHLRAIDFVSQQA